MTPVSYNFRPFAQLATPRKTGMGNAIVDQLLPTERTEHWGSFLMVNHWEETFGGGRHQRELGLGPLPHRGVSAITLVLEGEIHHRDSLGHDRVLGAGGVHCTHAGKGITLSERPSRQLAELGGQLSALQIWLHEPEGYIDSPAAYMAFEAAALPKMELPLKAGSVRLISGEYTGMKSPVCPSAQVCILQLGLEKGAEYTIETQQTHELMLYLMDGWAEVNGHSLVGKTLLSFGAAQEGGVKLVARERISATFLSGKPMQGSVVRYGSFVMQEEGQVLQAMRDAQMGKMGILIEEF